MCMFNCDNFCVTKLRNIKGKLRRRNFDVIHVLTFICPLCDILCGLCFFECFQPLKLSIVFYSVQLYILLIKAFVNCHAES